MHGALRSQGPVVNVLIAEASHLACQLLENALQPRRHGVAVIASAVDSHHALALLEERKPDIAVVSAHLEEGPLEGYRVLEELRARQSRTRAIMLLDSREREFVTDAFRCGAHGVIFRDEPLEIVGKCIRAVHQGQVWASSEHLGYLLDILSHAAPARLRNAHALELLTKRQKDVARLVCEGLTNREISAQLGLSGHTVRNYLFQIFDKLGVSTRLELALCCLHKKEETPAVKPNGTACGTSTLLVEQLALRNLKR